MSWKVTLEVDSELKPTELAIMVNMFPGVNDCYISKSSNQDKVNTAASTSLDGTTEHFKNAPDAPGGTTQGKDTKR